MPATTSGSIIRSRRVPSDGHNFRVVVGGPDCKEPYSLSLLNISAMSFGALSANAIRALNKGAKIGGFAHDTGEGGFSKYHREFGGDIIWEIGSGYFGCRNPDGSFCAERFDAGRAHAAGQDDRDQAVAGRQARPRRRAARLPRCPPEIAAARGVPKGIDCVSPARHPAFATPVELMHFIAQLRELCGGKPVGFKLCIGHPWEFMAICKAMLETGIRADFVVIDGKEGGTGAVAARIRRPRRNAAARGTDLCPQHVGGRGPARHRAPRSERTHHHRLRHGARSRARGRLVQCRARLHVCARLRAVADAATPTIVRPELRHRIRCASARSSWKRKRSAWPDSITTRSPLWASWSEPPAWRILTSCARIT